MPTPLTISRSWLILLAVACLLAAAPALAAGEAEADSDAVDEPLEVTLAVVIGNLRREFSGSVRRGEGWPRTTADFAQEHNWTLDQPELLGALVRRLDRNPTREGYIKWQLLSFEPDLASLPLEEWERLLRMAPEPLSVPSPRPQRSRGGDFEVSFFSGRQVGFVRSIQGVAGDGVAVYRPRVGVISGSGIIAMEPQPDFSAEGVVQLNRDLANARRQIRRANQPIYAYRNALLMEAPRRNGLRFAALLRETARRLEARDTSAAAVVEYLLKVGPTLVDELEQATRETLLRHVAELGRWQIDYTRAFDVDLQGELVANTEPLRLPREEVELLALLLNDVEEFKREMAARREAEENAVEADDVARLPAPEPDAVADP